MKRKYLVKFTKIRQNDLGFNVPVLPWDEMEGLNTYWTTTVDDKGEFTRGYVIATISGKDLSELDAHPNVTILPEIDSEKQVSEVPTKEITDLKAKSKELGLNIDSVRGDTKIESVVELVGKQVQANFDIKSFDIEDIV